MTIRQFAAGVAAVGIALAVPAAAPAIGRFDINPVIVNFTARATSASVAITNTGAAPQELEIGVDTWSRSDGSDSDQSTDDIVASPSIFIVAPGQTQLIRLGPARDLSGDVERTYRLVATEVPAANGGPDVQTILRMRLPVFVIPQRIEARPLTWRVARADATRLAVSTENTGNVHERVRSLRVTVAGRVVFDEVVAAYVLAHQSRQWYVPLKSGGGSAAGTVHATEMDGATQDQSFSVQ
jgi:fimbrial chaperone protein